MRRHLTAALALAVVAACSDRPALPTAPDTPGGAPRRAAVTAAPTDSAGDYIVLFRPGTANPDGVTDDLLRPWRTPPRARYRHAVQGFAATLPAAALEPLRRNPNVLLVEPDGIATASAEQTLTSAQWGLDRLDVRPRSYDLRYHYDTDGTGVHVYILDTGIKLSHPEFGGRATFYANYSSSPSTDDIHGHGTHVAGTVGGTTVGVSKNVALYAVKVLGDNGSGSYSGIIAAVDAVTGIKQANPGRPMVGNMSLGGGVSLSLNTAVNNSVAAGVVWAVAAGNSNANACNASPSSATSALTVGASTSADARASFSNYGTCVDLFAPGAAIYSSTNDGGYASWNGTSMASPHVAGAAALYLSANPAASATAVNSWVVGNATTDLLTGIGTGSPNRLLYTLATAPPLAPMHLGALDATRTRLSNHWSASVTITMHDASHAVLDGVLVTVALSGAANGTASCTTDAAGRCTITQARINNKRTALTFTVTGATRAGYQYTPASNDVAASITVVR